MVSLPPREKRITLPKLASREGVSPTSTWRWALRGINGIVLRTVCVGRTRLTCDEWYSEFVAAVTAARDGGATSQAPAQRADSVARAERETAAAGI